MLDRPMQHAVAEPERAVLPCALPAVKYGHARLERDVPIRQNDPGPATEPVRG